MGVLFFLIQIAHADDWESKVNGQQAFDQVQALLNYKKAQATEIESVFYGLREKLYVVKPSTETEYENNFYTPSTVKFTIKIDADYDTKTLESLYSSIKSARYLQQGENTIKIRFPKGSLTIKLYDEILPTYQDLVQGGYAFEARAILLDDDQTIIATSDNSLLLSVPLSREELNFTNKPLLRSYEKIEPFDITSILEKQGVTVDEKLKELQNFLQEPTYRLINSNQADFYSLSVDDLKNVKSCRILRESDELLLYKKDLK